MTQTTIATAQCMRCSQPLTLDVDVQRGYDGKCRTLLLKAVMEISGKFSETQIRKAAQALRTGTVKHYDGDTFQVQSSNEQDVYWTTQTTCTCPARKPCYHMCTVRIRELTPVR